MLSHRLEHFIESVIRDMSRLAVTRHAVNLARGFPDFHVFVVITGIAILSLSITTSTIAGLFEENACSRALSSSSGRSTLNPSPPQDFAKSEKLGLMNSIPNAFYPYISCSFLMFFNMLSLNIITLTGSLL